MRTKKAIYNTIASFLLELVTTVCSFILPQLILSAFGSKYNGITSSISQFVSYVALLRSGVGGVTRAALYKVLNENDTPGISAIVRATEKFMQKVAMLFIGFLLIFAVIYPFFVKEDFSWLFSFTLVLIISMSTVAQYYFGFTYQMLLMADQRNYISAIISIVTTIINTLVAVILIKAGFGIHAVKLGSALVFTINPIVLKYYVSRRYNIIRDAAPNMDAISQRWDFFAHQIANFVHGNTDIVILTLLSTLEEVSVYSVYAMVITGVRRVVNIISKGMEAAFGSMIANNEEKALYNNLERLEFIIYYVSGICFTCAAVLITPFAAVYTKGVNDADYIRPVFGMIMALSGLLWCLRIPYQSVVLAAGRFKETKNGAIAEPIINIVLSVILVLRFGIVGVAIGTVAAMLFRTVQYGIYMSENLVIRPVRAIVRRFGIETAAVLSSGFAAGRIILPCENFKDWIILALARGSVILFVFVIFMLIFDRKICLSSIKKILWGFKK